MKRKFRASFSGFHVDSISGVRHNIAGEIKLPAKELAVLVELIQHTGKLVTKSQLVKAVWGDYSASDSSIARCISAIRSILSKAEPNCDNLIQMVYGKGYKFVGEVSASASYLCEESFSTLINASPDFILFKDSEGRWLSANDAALETFGLAHLPWQGKTDLELTQLLPAAYYQPLVDCVASDLQAWEHKKPSKALESVPLGDGSKRHYEVIKSPLFHEDGSRNLLVIFGRDITDLLQAMDKHKLAQQALANSHEAVIITDQKNNIISVNRAFSLVSEYNEAEVLGKNPKLLASGRHEADFYEAMWHEITRNGTWRGEIWNKRKNGTYYRQWLEISTARNVVGELSNHIAVFSELHTQSEKDSQFEFLAYHDSLTRLPNRLLLQDRFQKAVAAAKRTNTLLAVLFLDLDQFKRINDNLGHAAGDKLLIAVGQRLEGCVRGVDTVSRIGGDEFVLLLTQLQTVDAAAHIADKILACISPAVDVGNMSVVSALSMGIAIYPHDAIELDSLLEMADIAMYRAKNSGGNHYRFFTENSTDADSSSICLGQHI